MTIFEEVCDNSQNLAKDQRLGLKSWALKSDDGQEVKMISC